MADEIEYEALPSNAGFGVCAVFFISSYSLGSFCV